MKISEKRVLPTNIFLRKNRQFFRKIFRKNFRFLYIARLGGEGARVFKLQSNKNFENLLKKCFFPKNFLFYKNRENDHFFGRYITPM
jgi:hypothetical protein